MPKANFKSNEIKYKMKKYIFLAFFLTTLISCDVNSEKTKNTSAQVKQINTETSTQDTSPKVTGIGGVFFFSDNPEKIRKWYSDNLGLEVNQWGSSFEFRNAHRPDEINYLQWSPFKKGNAYFSPSKKEFMINYRVQKIEALVYKLKSKGVSKIGRAHV